MLSGLAAFALAVGGSTAAVAEEEPVVGAGSISGVVTYSVDGSAMEGVDVHAASDDGSASADAVTDQTGAYTLEGLVDGDYVLRFSTPSDAVAAEYYDDTRDEWRAERIAVRDGVAVTGIDAVLDPPPSGSISGVVTREDDGSPIAGVTVSASGDDGSWASAVTDDDGSYSLPELAPAAYVVTFFAEGTDLTREYWENATTYAAATPVVLGHGTAVTGVDAALAAGGAITGFVTREEDGAAVEGAFVTALTAQNEIAGSVLTGPGGEYRLGGLADGDYVVRFASADGALVAEYWNDVRTFDEATPVTVAVGQPVPQLDAALGAMGRIEGTVTRAADGSPVFGAVILRAAGQGGDVQTVDVDSEGAYSAAVVPGSYIVEFQAYEPGFLPEFWDDARTAEAATSIDVATGETVGGIDAQLDSAALISGTVSIDTDETTERTIEAWDGDVRVASVITFSDEYSLYLPAGTYILKASAVFEDSRTTAKPQFYDGVATAAEATPVTATLDEPTEGIDFTLVPETMVEPEPSPTLSLSADTIRAGSDMTLSGSGFAPGQKVDLELRSDPIALGTLTADASGVLAGTVRIPASAPAGTHTLVALSGTTVLASAALVVTAAPGTAGPDTGDTGSGAAAGPGDALAGTGAEVPVALLALAVLLAAAGGVFVRRRRGVAEAA